MDTKRCTQCHQVKPLSEFRTDKRASDGRRSECAECTREYKREWRRRNIEKVHAYHRQWYKENKEKAQHHKEKWRLKNPNYDTEQSRQWRIAHPKQYKKTRHAYFERTREAHRQRERAYRARKQDATVEDVTARGWLEIVQAYDSRCVYCGEVCDSPSMDHVIPISQGGAHSYDNILPACLDCNRKKAARTPEQADMPIILGCPSSLSHS